MEQTSKLLEQLAFNTRSKKEEHLLVVMDKSTHEEHLSQPLQTNNEQFKMAVTFLTVYKGIFNVTYLKIKFYSKRTITNEKDFIQFTMLLSAYENESLNIEVRRIIIDKGHFTESDYPFRIKQNFSTLRIITEKSPQGSIIGFVLDDSIRNLLGFNENSLYKA